MSATEFVLNSTYDNYAKQLERRLLKERGTAPTWVTILNNTSRSQVVEVQPDRKGCMVRVGWREVMRQFAESYNE